MIVFKRCHSSLDLRVEVVHGIGVTDPSQFYQGQLAWGDEHVYLVLSVINEGPDTIVLLVEHPLSTKLHGLMKDKSRSWKERGDALRREHEAFLAKGWALANKLIPFVEHAENCAFGVFAEVNCATKGKDGNWYGNGWRPLVGVPACTCPVHALEKQAEQFVPLVDQ